MILVSFSSSVANSTPPQTNTTRVTNKANRDRNIAFIRVSLSFQNASSFFFKNFYDCSSITVLNITQTLPDSIQTHILKTLDILIVGAKKRTR